MGIPCSQHPVLCWEWGLETPILVMLHSHQECEGCYFSSHFTDDKIEAQRGKVTYAMSHDYKWQHSNSDLTHS